MYLGVPGSRVPTTQIHPLRGYLARWERLSSAWRVHPGLDLSPHGLRSVLNQFCGWWIVGAPVFAPVPQLISHILANNFDVMVSRLFPDWVLKYMSAQMVFIFYL